jgi:uncharacterized phage infection (PIP) family protein YhgE
MRGKVLSDLELFSEQLARKHRNLSRLQDLISSFSQGDLENVGILIGSLVELTEVEGFKPGDLVNRLGSYTMHNRYRLSVLGLSTLKNVKYLIEWVIQWFELSIQDELQRHKSEMESLSEKLENLSSEKDQAHDQVNKLQEINKLLVQMHGNALQNVKQEKNRLETRIVELENTIFEKENQAFAQMEEKDKESYALSKELETIKVELSRIKEEEPDLIKQQWLEEELKKARNDISNLQTGLEKYKAETQELRGQNQALERNYKLVEDMRQLKDKEIVELRQLKDEEIIELKGKLRSVEHQRLWESIQPDCVHPATAVSGHQFPYKPPSWSPPPESTTDPSSLPSYLDPGIQMGTR